MDNEIVWLLLHDLEEGKITANQFRAAVTNAEIENLKKNIDSLYLGYAQSLNSPPYGNIWKSTEYTTKKKTENPCAGCKFRKYHDWAEPTWTGFSAHYYDCENPSCPNWNRLWWRNNDDGSPLLDQEPIKLKRKIQHAAYALVTWMNNEIKTILEGADV